MLDATEHNLFCFVAPPERVSLLTQVILGVSLGVNISIAAFFMGRISANSDFLSGFV